MASENEIQVLSSSRKRPWKKWLILLAGIVVGVLTVVLLPYPQPQKETATYIDSTLQAAVEDILREKLDELRVPFGQAIVMETRTGAIKAMIGLQRNFDKTYVRCDDILAHQQATGLIRPFSYLAALETQKVKLTDTVDTQRGIYLTDGIVMEDHNVHRGGYGLINYEQGLMFSSQIATYKVVQKAFANRPQTYFDALDSLAWGKVDRITGIPKLNPPTCLTPKDSLWAAHHYPFSTIGYNQQVATVQVLASYNAIANNGRMVKPKIYKGETEVVKEHIASAEAIKAIQQAMRHTITDGLGRPASSEKVAVAGASGVCTVSDGDDDSERKQFTEFAVEFCGYFPFEEPRYTIIVSLNKMGYPASGSAMAGVVFGQIVEYMLDGTICANDNK